jgi:hypothetical protein
MEVNPLIFADLKNSLPKSTAILHIQRNLNIPAGYQVKLLLIGDKTEFYLPVIT